MIDLFRGGVLLYNPIVEHGNFVAHAHCLRLVMGDEYRSKAQGRDKIFQFVAHLLPEKGIQGRQWLVKEDAAGFDDNGPGESHPLLLPAGKLVRIPLGQVLQVYPAQGFPSRSLLNAPPAFAPAGQKPHFQTQSCGATGRSPERQNLSPAFPGEGLPCLRRKTHNGHQTKFPRCPGSPARRSSAAGWFSPQPDGPSKVVNFPLGMVNVVGAITRFSPNAFVISCKRISISTLLHQILNRVIICYLIAAFLAYFRFYLVKKW